MSTRPQDSSFLWFGRGMRGMFSVPALMLLTSMVGFGVLCRESGITLAQAMFMTGAIWALPSQVILVGAVVSGASLVSAGLAVSLSAIRFTPMLAAWAALVRGPKTSAWQLLVLGHFVAVTSYVFSAFRLPDIRPENRLPFFAGFAVTLTTVSVLVTGASHLFAGTLPPVIAGALFFLTPVYFLTALSATARIPAEWLGLIFGVLLGPPLASSGLPLALVWAGLIGGGLAYVGDRILRKRT